MAFTSIPYLHFKYIFIFLKNTIFYIIYCDTCTYNNLLTSAVQPFVVVCVQGLGPQLVQAIISFGPVVPVAPPSLFFLPYDRVSIEDTYIFNYKFFLLYIIYNIIYWVAQKVYVIF